MNGEVRVAIEVVVLVLDVTHVGGSVGIPFFFLLFHANKLKISSTFTLLSNDAYETII